MKFKPHMHGWHNDWSCWYSRRQAFTFKLDLFDISLIQFYLVINFNHPDPSWIYLSVGLLGFSWEIDGHVHTGKD